MGGLFYFPSKSEWLRAPTVVTQRVRRHTASLAAARIDSGTTPVSASNSFTWFLGS
jgi:hypothetical protein